MPGLLRQALALPLDHILTPAVQAACQAAEAPPSSIEVRRVHVLHDLLHALREVGMAFVKPVAQEPVVQQAPDVGNGCLVEVDVAPFCHEPGCWPRVVSDPTGEARLLQRMGLRLQAV